MTSRHADHRCRQSLGEPPDLWVSRMSAEASGATPSRKCGSTSGSGWSAGTSATRSSRRSRAGRSQGGRAAAETPADGRGSGSCRVLRQERSKLDEYGIYAQVLYPNLLAFTHHAFTAVGSEFATVRSGRTTTSSSTSRARAGAVHPVGVLPFWDIEAAVAEIERCARTTSSRRALHRQAVQARAARPRRRALGAALRTGQRARLADELPHRVRGVLRGRAPGPHGHEGRRRDNARSSALSYLANAESIAEVSMTGSAPLPEHRLRVGGERVRLGAGVRRVHGLAVAQRRRPAGVPRARHAEHYFRRQVYGMFWFETERSSARSTCSPTTSCSRPTSPTPPASRPDPPRRPNPRPGRVEVRRRAPRRARP